ncbi:MAG TPA: hypothetical protein VIJ17_03835, partial [Pseudolabrys sp.]
MLRQISFADAGIVTDAALPEWTEGSRQARQTGLRDMKRSIAALITCVFVAGIAAPAQATGV